MARTWLSIQVELVGGRGELLWPRPGRILAAARRHTFAALAIAIDDAFARWDRAHLHEFRLAGGQRVGLPELEWFDEDEVLDMRRLTLGRLQAGERFVYVFDFGDDWAHLCRVGERRIDPLEELGVAPDAPLPYWGWGAIPDQYGRRFDEDDGETGLPPDPAGADLSPNWPQEP